MMDDRDRKSQSNFSRTWTLFSRRAAFAWRRVRAKRPIVTSCCLALVALVGVYLISYTLGYNIFARTVLKSSPDSRSRLDASHDKAPPAPPPIFADDPSARAAHEAAYEEQMGRKLRKPDTDSTRISGRKRLIVLYTEGEKINTGVWPGWGGHNREVTLNWAAAGVKVQKMCPLSCEFTHDNSRIPTADAVVIELVNHPKFGISENVVWPERRRQNPRGAAEKELPLRGLFYYEPTYSYPSFTLASEDVASQFDFTATHSQSTTIPVTLVCPWGREVDDFLKPPPQKQPGHLVAYFSEHGCAGQFSQLLNELFDAAGSDTGNAPNGLHAFVHRKNRDLPPEASGDPFQLSTRIDFVGTYRFVLITEGTEEADFISPEWSQSFLSGTVPIYLGAPNIEHYAPGPKSYINARDFSNGADLWNYLQTFVAADESSHEHVEKLYSKFFYWKAGANAAFTHDEGGQRFPIGSGASTVEQWPQSHDEVAASVKSSSTHPWAEETSSEEERKAFTELSEWGWRLYREKLDHCVHYAECRICKKVHELT